MRPTHMLPAAVILAAAVPAIAQIDSREGIALQNQILELRQEIQQLQAQGGGGGAPAVAAPVQPPESAPPGAAGSGDVAADLVVRVSSLEEQMRALQGRVDELENAVKKQNDDLSKQIGDLAFKLGQGGAAPAPGTPSLQPAIPPGSADATGETPAGALPPPAVAPPPLHRKPEVALKLGNAALARHDYPAAAAAAREVIAAGHGPRVADAQFLLARAQFGQHQYQDAATQYYQVYSAAPRTPRAAEALLGVSNALLGLNDGKDACEALAKLAVEFPRPEPGVRAGAAAARKRARCH